MIFDDIILGYFSVLFQDIICSWCCGPHGARIHTHFGDVTVPVLLLTSFWRSFLFLHRVLLSTVQGPAASRTITTGQNFLFWSLHSLESNSYQNKRYGDSKGALQRDPCSKRALLEENVIYATIVFKVLQSCDAGIACRKVSRLPVTKRLQWFVNNNRFAWVQHFLGIKLWQYSNKFIHIVT